MINDGIVDAKESGEYERIYNKWIKPDSVIAKWIRLLIIILGCTGVIIILFVSWNVILRKKISRKTAELREEFDKLSKTQIALAENERKLRQAQKMESVGRMASGLAHDFNNILTVILNYADFLRQDLLNSEHDTTFVDEILSASERASRLSRRLLTFSRDKPADKVLINLNQSIYELSGMIQQLIGEENTLSLSIPDKSIFISADRTGIEQILLNLAANARDAMTEKGTLSITLSEEYLDSNNSYNLNKGIYANIQVSDTGCGMKEEVLSHISEPFFTTKEIGKGTGLGLSSSFSVIFFHGGTVRVHSEIGKGSVFNILLPASINTDPVYTQSQQHHDTFKFTDKILTILFVEDDDTLRHATRTALARYGFNVFDAGNGESALAIFNEIKTIDVVITDVVMPKLNGQLMVGKIRSTHPSLPVLYVSGYVQKENEIDLNSSRTLFLPKPYTNEQLIDSIFSLFK
jgi:two-component system cell cycle sensor histidine kinase/response regulator CckA